MRSPRRIRNIKRLTDLRRQARDRRAMVIDLRVKALAASYLSGSMSGDEYMRRYVEICRGVQGR